MVSTFTEILSHGKLKFLHAIANAVCDGLQFQRLKCSKICSVACQSSKSQNIL
jgi:hypothetical protein